ncbi:MAG: GxxExxY protein [Alphaproteobacteria bacterium]
MSGRVKAKHENITERIIGAAMEVSNFLGHGFLETVYEKALVGELQHRDLIIEEQKRYSVLYKGEPVGTFVPDILVEGRIIVELKAIDRLSPSHTGLVLNYLKVADLDVGLLFNFGRPKLEFKRVLR